MALRVLVLAAALSTAASNELACVSSYDASVDYFPDKVTPTASELWTIEYFNSYKVINMTVAGVVYSTVAYQCGTTQPTVSYATQYVSVPVDTVAVASTTDISFVELLGERESLVAYTSSFGYVTSPCLLAMYDAGLSFQAYDASSWARDDAMLANLSVDVTFAGPWDTTAYNAYVISPASEGTNLAVAEYVKVFGAMYNQEAAANAVYDEIEARFTCTAANALLYGDATLNVLWVSYYAGGWTVGSCPNYYCEYIEKAGGAMIETDITGSIVTSWGAASLNNSEILSVAAAADVVLYSGGDWNAVVTAEPATTAAIHAIVGGTIYDNAKRCSAGCATNDWFESRLANPDAVLEDISSILHGVSSHTTTYWRDPYTDTSVGTGLATSCAGGYDSTPELLSDACYSPTAAPTAVPTPVVLSGARRAGALAAAASAALLALAGLALAA